MLRNYRASILDLEPTKDLRVDTILVFIATKPLKKTEAWKGDQEVHGPLFSEKIFWLTSQLENTSKMSFGFMSHVQKNFNTHVLTRCHWTFT